MKRSVRTGLLGLVLAGSVMVAISCRKGSSSGATVFQNGSMSVHVFGGMHPNGSPVSPMAEICPTALSFLLSMHDAGFANQRVYLITGPADALHPLGRVAYLDTSLSTPALTLTTAIAAPAFTPSYAVLEGIDHSVDQMIPPGAVPGTQGPRYNVVCRGIADPTFPLSSIEYLANNTRLTIDLPTLRVGAFNELFNGVSPPAGGAPLPPMPPEVTYRYIAASSLLPQSWNAAVRTNGGAVLVAGGLAPAADETSPTTITGGQLGAHVHRFDPQVMAFVGSVNLTTAMAAASANSFLDNNLAPFVVFAGGATLQGGPLHNMAAGQVYSEVPAPGVGWFPLTAPRAFHAAEVLHNTAGNPVLVLIGGCGIDGASNGRSDWEPVTFPSGYQGISPSGGCTGFGPDPCSSPPPPPSNGLLATMNHPECMMAHAVLTSSGTEGIWLGPGTIPVMESNGIIFDPPNHPGTEQYFFSLAGNGFSPGAPIPYPKLLTGQLQGAWGGVGLPLNDPNVSSAIGQLNGIATPYPGVADPLSGGGGQVPEGFVAYQSAPQTNVNAQPTGTPAGLPPMAMPAVASISTTSPAQLWLVVGSPPTSGGGNPAWIFSNPGNGTGSPVPPQAFPISSPTLHRHAPGAQAMRIWGSPTWLNGSILVVGGPALSDPDPGWPELYVPGYDCNAPLPPGVDLCTASELPRPAGRFDH